MTFHLFFCHSFFGACVFACLPIFPIYFWKRENAEDVFVGLTWKCFFFSTSCFHRPFVRSNCAACHALPSPPTPFSRLVGAVMCWSGRKAFFDFCIISCSVQSSPPDFPSIPALICCANLRLHTERRVFNERQSKGKWVVYSFLMKTGNGRLSAGASR